jgi:hypothetical protein
MPDRTGPPRRQIPGWLAPRELNAGWLAPRELIAGWLASRELIVRWTGSYRGRRNVGTPRGRG